VTRRASRTSVTHTRRQSTAHDNPHAAVWRGLRLACPREERAGATTAAAPVLQRSRFCRESQSGAAQGRQRDHIATKCNDDWQTLGARATNDVHGRSVSMGALLRPLQQCRIRRSGRPLEVRTTTRTYEGMSKEGAEAMTSCALAVGRSRDRAHAVAAAGTECDSLFLLLVCVCSGARRIWRRA